MVTLTSLIITLLGIILVSVLLVKAPDKRKYLTAQEGFSTTNGGDLKTKAIIRYYNNFSLGFHVKTQDPNVVLVSLNTDPIIVVKLDQGVLLMGVVPSKAKGPLPLTFAPTRFIRSTITLNDNDWHYVRLSFNESINRLICRVDNNPLVTLPLAKPTWDKVRISFGKVDGTTYTSVPFKGCFLYLSYKDELRFRRLTKVDMVSTYSMKVC